MFTGIIEEVGKVKALSAGGLTIAARLVLQGTAVGDSLSVNGICLTVTKFTEREFVADVMPETFRRTSLGELKPGSPVNLERALTLSGRLGGHIVSGHIDGVGHISAWREEANAILMTVKAAPEITRYIVEKGSVALDGISLTVAKVTKADFTVSLIPHTRDITNLGSKKIGDALNIETDVIGKYVEKLMGLRQTMSDPGRGGNITKEFLAEYGY